MQELKTSENQQTMSSREISTLLGKRHDHVKRDIEAMLESLSADTPKFGGIYKDSRNREQLEYHLNRYYTEVLITGYDVKRRAAVIRRWYDLETGKAQVIEKPEAKQLEGPHKPTLKSPRDPIRDELTALWEPGDSCYLHNPEIVSDKDHDWYVSLIHQVAFGLGIKVGVKRMAENGAFRIRRTYQ